jgi:sulfate adenylyltransferase
MKLFISFLILIINISSISANELKTERKQGVCIYFTGLSGSGKSTLSEKLKERLLSINIPQEDITILDGDIIRTNISNGLGFSKKDRSINVRRIGFIASLIVKHKGICICANIAPYEEDRTYNRENISKYGKYVEVFVNTPLNICEIRDVKGLYKKARSGVIKLFTGINDPYEIPTNADLIIDGTKNIDNCIERIIDFLAKE